MSVFDDINQKSMENKNKILREKKVIDFRLAYRCVPAHQ